MWLGEGHEVEGVEAAETAEGEDDGSQLLVAAADVGPVAGTDHLPEPLILGSTVPELAHTRSRRKGPGIHVLQHLEQHVLVEVLHHPNIASPSFIHYTAQFDPHLLHHLRIFRFDRTLHLWERVGVQASGGSR